MKAKKEIKRLGIMGGTFDPIHLGHLISAESARTLFQLDQVVFVPAGRPPHKTWRKEDDGEHRVMMTELAILSNPHFILSRLELEREGYSYSIDTVRHFVNEYGSAVEIFFITGADAILEISTWKNAADLLQLCTFIAATRPGFNLEELAHLEQAWQQKIRVMEIPMLAISSTDIRSRVAAGRTIRYLVPENVELYIKEHGLYQTVADDEEAGV